MNLEDAAALLEECNILSARKRPGVTIVETDEIFQVLDPSRPFATANSICRTNFAPGREEESISSAMDRYGAKSLPFRWYVFPGSRPKDLAARLSARNPTLVLPQFGFAAPCAMAHSIPAPEISLEPLSASNLEEYILVGLESFAEIGRSTVDTIKGLAVQAVRSPDPDYLIFLARCAGEPAGFCAIKMVRDGNKAAGFLGGAGVRPAFRHRGVMRAMIKQRAQEMLRRGLEFMLVYSNARTSAPIFRKLGFHEVFPFQIFDFSVERQRERQ